MKKQFQKNIPFVRIVLNLTKNGLTYYNVEYLADECESSYKIVILEGCNQTYSRIDKQSIMKPKLFSSTTESITYRIDALADRAEEAKTLVTDALINHMKYVYEQTCLINNVLQLHLSKNSETEQN